MQGLYALKITISDYCGYRCKYCYVNTDSRKVISEKLMYQSIDYYLSQKGDNKKIFFLGGEALLQFDLLKKGILYIKKHIQDKNIIIFLTTSTLSLTNDKANFLYSYGVKIGVSIDGNEYIHGLNRISRLGTNTFSSTIEGIKMLNKYYSSDSLGYAMTIDENTVSHTFKSFLFLSHLDIIHRNITIAGVYKKSWKKENIDLLEKEIKKICTYICEQINQKNFYYYNVLSFFILSLLSGKILDAGNIEMHIFPNGQVSQHLFAQSVLGNIGDDPTAGRFRFVNVFARYIIMMSQKDNDFLLYIQSLSSKPIL